GQYDGFLVQIDANGSKTWGTYYGGPQSEEVYDVAINPSDQHIAFTGYTSSSSGIASANAHQTSLNGGLYDGLLVRMCAPILPQLQHSIGDSLCDNQTMTISVDPTIFDSYSWQDNSTTSTFSTAGLPNGQQNIYVATVDTNGCPATSDTLSFNHLPATALTIQNAQSNYCEGDTVKLFTTDDFNSYTWSTASTDTFITISGLESGTYEYSLSAQNNAGCISSDTITVTIHPTPEPEINVQGAANFCLNETVDVGVQSSFANYLWHDGQTSNTITLQSEDSVWVYVENSFGCGNFSDTVFVNSELLTPVITTNSAPPFCAGDTIHLGVNNTYDDYLWDHGGTDSTSSAVLSGGTFYTTVEVANQCGGNAVSDTFEIEVTTPAALTINTTMPDTNCVGAVYTFAIDTTFQNTTWSNGENDWTANYAPSAPGNYQATVITTDSNGCQLRDTVNFTIGDCYLELGTHPKEGSYTIYPNPTTGKVEIDFPHSNAPYSVTILDAAGRHTGSIEAIDENPYTLQLNNLNPGVYYIVPSHERLSLPTKKVLILR
ncbi:MAG: T9SS type A sorting domain-containing protein, partial [Bacteroidota bacterium]